MLKINVGFGVKTIALKAGHKKIGIARLHRNAQRYTNAYDAHLSFNLGMF